MENTQESEPQEQLYAELERQRDQLRDYEKALVERIADVDDDRRATASRLQRAWQTQREEIDDRLRRYAGVVAGLLILFAVLIAVALFFVYRQATLAQPQLAADVSEMRQQLEGLSAADVVGQQVRDDLTRLSADIDEVTSSLKSLGQGADRASQSTVADERAARESGEARVADAIGRLDAEQKRIEEELKSLREALAAVESGRGTESGAVDSAVMVDPRIGGPAMPGETADAAPNGDADASEVGPGAQEAGERTSAAESAPATEHQAPVDEDPAGAERDAEALGSGETVVAGEGSYALQLIGFYNRNSLAEFAAREGLPARVYYLRQTYKDRPWFALVHSIHDGFAAAAQELARLPEDLVSLNPWIRPVPAGTALRVLETGPEQSAIGE